MSSRNAIVGWDFTTPAHTGESDDALFQRIKEWCRDKCKSWCFQLEEGESGYVHYQGRVRLRLRVRSMFGQLSPAHWSPSHVGDDIYVTKEETRIEGPWRDTDPYIPKQIKIINELYIWQKKIIASAEIFDTRSINYVHCPGGNIGKSTLVGWIRAYKLGRALPPVNNAQDLLRMVCDLPTSNLYIFDMPRAMKKEKLWGFYSAIETIKDGYAYDDRYDFKEKIFDCPCIWIFSNCLPDLECLSTDRWKIWNIINKDLVEVV